MRVHLKDTNGNRARCKAKGVTMTKKPSEITCKQCLGSYLAPRFNSEPKN